MNDIYANIGTIVDTIQVSWSTTKKYWYLHTLDHERVSSIEYKYFPGREEVRQFQDTCNNQTVTTDCPVTSNSLYDEIYNKIHEY